MKKVKGSALLWCLTVLIVLAVITVTGVMMSARYYKKAVKDAGNSQAYYNSEAAAKLLISRLEGKLGEKQIYFTYMGNSMLDSMSPSRSTAVTYEDIDYFGAGLSEDILTVTRSLENELMTEYIKNNGKERRPLTISYNYGKLDSSVYSHGYYGDTAEIYIESITDYDSDEDGEMDSYIALVKAQTTLNTGHTSAVGARFIIQPAVFNSENIPVLSCKVMDIGVPEEGKKVYAERKGILLGLSQGSGTGTPCVIVSGDSGASDMAKWGFIRTDGTFSFDESGTEKIFNEVSLLDRNTFKMISKNNKTDKYVELHDINNMMFSDEYMLCRGEAVPDHSFGLENILSDSDAAAALELNVRVDPPKAFSAGDRTGNIVKRYYVTGGRIADTMKYCYYDGTDGREYAMSFEEYVSHQKNGTASDDDPGFTDIYSTDSDLICCNVERRVNSGGVMTINPNDKIELNDIVLEDGKKYFFRICQDTRISFAPSCRNVNADVYFQLYNDTACGGGQYGIDLELVDPPQNINIFAFDKSGVSSLVSPDNPAAEKNVTIEINNDTPDDYTVSGWFSCYRFSIADRTAVGSESAVLLRKNVKLRAAKPKDHVTVFDPNESSVDTNKNYRWLFDRFIDLS